MENIEASAASGESRHIPPAERFATAEVALDPNAIANSLRSGQTHAPHNGHRSQAIFRKGHVTIVVFAFENGGMLPNHSAGGLVSIHALSGSLVVRTADAEYALRAGLMVVLAPNVVHSVFAHEQSNMLLTVALDKA